MPEMQLVSLGEPYGNIVEFRNEDGRVDNLSGLDPISFESTTDSYLREASTTSGVPVERLRQSFLNGGAIKW